MMTLLKSDHILKIKKSQRLKVENEIFKLEEIIKDVYSKYLVLHSTMKSNSYGIMASLSRLMKSSQDYSSILIKAQSIMLSINDAKNMTIPMLNIPPLYMTRWEKQYYQLMVNYIKAMAHSVEIIINHLQIIILKKQGLDHPKTSKSNYNCSRAYYLASRLNCKKLAEKIETYKTSVVRQTSA